MAHDDVAWLAKTLRVYRGRGSARPRKRVPRTRLRQSAGVKSELSPEGLAAKNNILVRKSRPDRRFALNKLRVD